MNKKTGVFIASVVVAASFQLASCMSAYKQSVGGDTSIVVSKTFMTEFDVAWQAVLESLKSARLDVSNREGGFLQTRWLENTSEKNLADSFGSANAYLKAQYRLKISLAKGFYNGKEAVKIGVQKEQLVERDVLEGWRHIESDSVDENTLLYRIGRIIQIKTTIVRIEEEKTEREIRESEL
ncbi:MAG: hypothetical protein A2583_12765 [Bdellovibrionales bacterium RIFOXYD1_FULL_53_11]|nr:MAG: hypothetical protein A2583_12765 [Bdellovibrionales bacterium RIFOXYD1_FULL_53_11]